MHAIKNSKSPAQLFDVQSLDERTALELIEDQTDKATNSENYNKVSPGYQENGIKIIQSITCHQKIVFDVAVKMVQKGLAFTHEAKADDKTKYCGFFCMVSSMPLCLFLFMALYLKHYYILLLTM